MNFVGLALLTFVTAAPLFADPPVNTRQVEPASSPTHSPHERHLEKVASFRSAMTTQDSRTLRQESLQRAKEIQDELRQASSPEEWRKQNEDSYARMMAGFEELNERETLLAINRFPSQRSSLPATLSREQKEVVQSLLELKQSEIQFLKTANPSRINEVHLASRQWEETQSMALKQIQSRINQVFIPDPPAPAILSSQEKDALDERIAQASPEELARIMQDLRSKNHQLKAKTTR